MCDKCRKKSCSCESADVTISNKDILAMLGKMECWLQSIAAILLGRWAAPIIATGSTAHTANYNVWIQAEKDLFLNAELQPVDNSSGSAVKAIVEIARATVESGSDAVTVASRTVLVPNSATGSNYPVGVNSIIPKGSWYKVTGSYAPGWTTASSRFISIWSNL